MAVPGVELKGTALIAEGLASPRTSLLEARGGGRRVVTLSTATLISFIETQNLDSLWSGNSPRISERYLRKSSRVIRSPGHLPGIQ